MASRTKVLVSIAFVVALAVVAFGVLFAVRQADRAGAAPVCPGDDDSSAPGWMASHTDVDAAFDAHPFVGNGYLGLRVPPRGMGYAETGEPTGWPLYTPRYDGAFVAGLYGHAPGVADDREVAAAIPNWSTLTVGVGDDTYGVGTPADRITDFRQTRYLRCGLVRTALTWTSRDGKVTDLVYDVIADRTEQHVGAVHLTVVPRWSGELTVTDLLDGAGARRLTRTDSAADDNGIRVGFRTEGTGVDGAVASVLSSQAQPTAAPEHTVRQQAAIAVQAGKSYEVTKFVGVDTTLTAPDPATAAVEAAERAARKGWPGLLADSARAWRSLWQGDIEIPGAPELQSWARGALYSLYSATNSQQDNSISPVGLSSDNYAGAIFWDADIFMFPVLLQLSPQLAKSVVEYRYKTLPAAQANARQLGFRGAFYPWTSESRGALAECHSWDPPHCLIQIHLQGDISLAAWQYYLGTGDTDYLRTRSWPIMRNLAEFWTSRVTPNADGSYSIDNIAGPDEYSNGVKDGAYTNAVAALALRNAANAAEILGEPVPPAWTTIADHLRIPFDATRQVFAQYDGYQGTPIKQADTVLLLYPLDWPMSQEVSANTLAYYAERTDPDGPAMTDSVHAIAAAALGLPGCAANTYLDRAVRPFERAPFGQFAEARGDKAGVHDPLAGAPAFTFTTAAGGFLQTFTNGLLGLRLRADEVRVDPMLPSELGSGLRLRGMHWQGRTFDADIGPKETRITLKDGAAMHVSTPAGTKELSRDKPLTVQTRRPDLAATDNLARCKPVTASSAEPGRYAEAAVDGSTATGWAPDAAHGTLTVDLGAETVVGRILPHWSSPVPSTVASSSDNRAWTTLTLDPTGAPATPTTARYLRLDVTAHDPAARPDLRELEVIAPK
ncbi:discoidin domain-containing protein [Nocardia altamirensis]|uniref:discoidin domain-containing protein n=1 Tax=Nocardia altamirensis TaxID=472158 RepID=UPI00084002CD|nr:discoidin domain-containing protein [Nocardia altamirensis]